MEAVSFYPALHLSSEERWECLLMLEEHNFRNNEKELGTYIAGQVILRRLQKYYFGILNKDQFQ